MANGQVRYRFGLFEADVANARLLRQGQPVRLQDQPFQLLVALLEAGGAIVTREELRQRLWRQDTFVEFDKSVGVALAKLRAALGDDAANPRFIETVPRRGYRFIAPVQVEGVAIPAPAALPGVDARVLEPADSVRSRRLTPAMVAAAAAVIVLAGIATVLYRRSAAGARLTERAAVVVGDFANGTGDTVFDGSLRRAAMIELAQSPYLHVLPDDALGEALQGLGHPPDQVLTPVLAREVCRRAHASAVVDGSIGRSGGEYRIAVSATRCDDGSVLARERVPVADKDQVLAELGRILEDLRRRFGESLDSLRKFNAPIELATTDSLDALRAYQLGMELRGRSENQKAIPAFKTAVALDPQFAIAYAQLGSAYSNQGDTDEATGYFRKAFALRDRATEPERLYITGRYFDIVTGELEKAAETYRLWTATYPEDWIGFNSLANDANLMGRYDVAADASRRTIALEPNRAFGYANLIYALVSLNRFPDVKSAAAAAAAHDRDNSTVHLALYAIGALEGDAAVVRRELDWAQKHPDAGGDVRFAAAEAAAFHGRLEESAGLFDEVARSDREAGNADAAGHALAAAAEIQTLMGRADVGARSAQAALALAQDEVTLGNVALVDAQTGRVALAQQQLEELGRRHPLSTVTMSIYTPMIRAALALERGSSTAEVTSLLAPAAPYELGQEADLYPIYLRGAAYAQVHAEEDAAREFRKLIAHVGVDPVTPLYPLSYLGLARAEASLGRTDDSRKAYETLLELWKDADPTLPLLSEARHERAAIRQTGSF